MNKDGLRVISDWLKNGAPHEKVDGEVDLGFNMEYWAEEDEYDKVGNSCGAVMCIAGAAHHFLGTWDDYVDDYHATARELLNLDYDIAFELFEPDHYSSAYNAAPKQAAAVIDNLIETGKVEWEKFGPYKGDDNE